MLIKMLSNLNIFLRKRLKREPVWAKVGKADLYVTADDGATCLYKIEGVVYGEIGWFCTYTICILDATHKALQIINGSKPIKFPSGVYYPHGKLKFEIKNLDPDFEKEVKNGWS